MTAKSRSGYRSLKPLSIHYQDIDYSSIYIPIIFNDVNIVIPVIVVIIRKKYIRIAENMISYIRYFDICNR